MRKKRAKFQQETEGLRRLIQGNSLDEAGIMQATRERRGFLRTLLNTLKGERSVTKNLGKYRGH